MSWIEDIHLDGAMRGMVNDTLHWNGESQSRQERLLEGEGEIGVVMMTLARREGRFGTTGEISVGIKTSGGRMKTALSMDTKRERRVETIGANAVDGIER